MKRIGLIISKYLVGAILPYFIFAWLLLSVILFVQQASRFSDIFFNVNIPGSLVWQLAVALIPNVIAFTCPMAILVGTVIGLARMQNDSELIAIRAAGVGTLQIALPIAILGVLLSVFAFFVNLRGVPIAAGLVRSVVLQTAIKKLESPIEPGVFNTEIAGYTIYVKGGDIATGRWSNIFIHNEDAASGATRLITSRSGRIDVTDDASELVLENATVSTIPNRSDAPKFVSENVGEVRFAIKTKRGELIEKLTTSTSAPEELGLAELAEFAGAQQGRERIEANILWYRRIVLAITPLLFCLLGTAMMLRFNRTGRGSAIAFAFAGLIGYYFLAFGGEQLARIGTVSPLVSALLAPVLTLGAIAYQGFAHKRQTRSFHLKNYFEEFAATIKLERGSRLPTRNFFVDLTTGLRDFDIGANLAKYFIFALLFLATIFVIFTAFELWKFAGTSDGGFALLAKYLFFLLPFVYLQLVPSATLIAVLATYVIKSRQNEVVTWISAGQSVYRLLIPCFVLAILIGIFNFGIQEWLAPGANIRQDELRTQLRKGGVLTNTSGRFWVANDRRVYSFQIPPGGQNFRAGEIEPVQKYHLASDNDMPGTSSTVQKGRGLQKYHRASDNDKPDLLLPKKFAEEPLLTGVGNLRVISEGGQVAYNGPGYSFPAFAMFTNITTASDNDKRLSCSSCVSDLVVYEFSQEGRRLQTVYRVAKASWVDAPGRGADGAVRLEGEVERSEFSASGITTTKESGRELAEETNPFSWIRGKPSHLSVGDLKSRVEQSESEAEQNTFSVAIHRRYSTLILPLVIALFTAPFALSLSRKGKAATVGNAVGLWLVFVGVTNVLAQFGDAGSLGAPVAVWAPLIIFSMFGIYLLSKLRT